MCDTDAGGSRVVMLILAGHVFVCVFLESVDYPTEQLTLRWITPRDQAVEFDPGGEDRSQFTIQGFHLRDCSYNSTKGSHHFILSCGDYQPMVLLSCCQQTKRAPSSVHIVHQGPTRWF